MTFASLTSLWGRASRTYLLSLWLFLGCVVPMRPAWSLDIQEVTGAKSGVKAWLVEDHNLPILAVHFAFAGGSEQDPIDKQGLASLMTRALTEGAGPYDASSFQKRLADRSITLGFAAGRDEIGGGLKCLSSDKDVAFDLLRASLTRPHFDRADIGRLRDQQLSSLRTQFANPNWQARFALFSQLFAGHPYAERHLGTTQTLQNITADDIKFFATQHLAKDNLIIAVAGDINARDLSLALDQIFSDLPARSQLTPITDVPLTTEWPTILLKREGTQSDVVFALPGPKRNDQSWYAAEIANYILGGGGFSSRLMHDVRDVKGLTYGLSMDLSASDHAGLIVGQSAIDNSKVSEALDTIHDTMRRFYEDGATKQEINAAKDYLTGSLPLQLTSTDKIAEMLVDIQHQNLGKDYLDRYSDLIRSVGDRDVKKAITTWFNPDKTTWVMVGKPEGVVFTQTKELVHQ